MSGSVVRTPTTRRHSKASPYARPAPSKSSGWSLTGFLSYLNPLRSRSPPPEEEVSLVEGDAASRLAARGQQLHSDAAPRPDRLYPVSQILPAPQPPIQPQLPTQLQPPPPPQAQVHGSLSPTSPIMNGSHRTSPNSDESQTSSSENLKRVQQFLDEKAGRPLNHVELAGLVHLLQNSVEDEDEPTEPFRFSKSPSTPARGTTPINFLSPSTSEQMVSAAGNTAQNVRKTLAKNPMGVYRWQGGGSARVRNRYQSPGFGTTTSRSMIKLVPEKPKADTKRRRVGEGATSPQRAGAPKFNGSPTSTMSTSVSAPAVLNTLPSSNAQTNGHSGPAPPATPRIRTNGVKPTAPVVPSPLRQTWSQSDSPPQAQASSQRSTSKPTRAASFMTELIKEVTPPKRPDFVNPYEVANHIVKPAPKKVMRRTRPAVKPETAPVKEPQLTPQAIIEATVPKGSKRSRPPPELVGSKPSEMRVTSPPEPSAPRRSTRLNGAEPATNGTTHSSASPPAIEEEEEPLPTKRQRTTKSPPVMSRNTVPIEIIDDIEMSTTSSSRTACTPSYPSEIIEPGDSKSDKKRSTSPTPLVPSFAPPRSGFNATKSSAPKAPSKLRFSINAEKDDKMDTIPSLPAFTPPIAETYKQAQSSAAKPKDSRTVVANMREEDLPKYSFTLPASSPGAGPSTLKARRAVMGGPVSTLPTYDFSKTSTAAPKPPVAFNWKGAGLQPPPQAAPDTWKCQMCMLVNPALAEKCTVCDEPRLDKPKAAAPVQGFNWAAAGMKMPTKSADHWTCSLCQLRNPDNVVQCTVCDTCR